MELIRIDPHVHSSGISLCSRVTVQDIVDQKKKLGYDGVVLTNHCQPWYYPAPDHKLYVERVIEEFHRAKAYGEKQNFRVYLGLEVTIPLPYGDWLLYGITEEFLRQSLCLYLLTQKELFELCEQWGVLLIQAHPLRRGCVLGNPEYMHGVELNCTPNVGDLERWEEIKAFAREHNLLVTCGTDYHFPERSCRGGIYVPKSCQSAVEIAAYIRESGGTRLFYEDEEFAIFAEK